MWYNPIVKLLLRSPLHNIVGSSFLLITFTGRKSGKVYTVPVQYVTSGNNLLIVSACSHTWWKNLRGGVAVSIRRNGRNAKATAQVLEDKASAIGLMDFLKSAPHLVRYFHVNLNVDGKPNEKEVIEAAKDKVVVEIQPD
jgi:deazaflavin-dependent oxidoreductase (nitroreductase family)